MTSNSMRSFAFGLIVAASICSAAFFFGSNKDIDTKKTITEMKNILSEEGYVVSTEEDWNKHNNEKNESSEQETKVIYKTMVSVSPGMTSIDVGKVLQQSHLIENAFQFSKEVERRGVSNNLRPGVYEVGSEMSIDEIITTIF